MNIAKEVVNKLRSKHYTFSTAESVTGGKLISMITEVPGASKILEQSYVVYSNDAKISVLGVDKTTIDRFGVVSEEVALEMAQHLKAITKADVVITTTGEAGPVKNEIDIALGTVCFGLIIADKKQSFTQIFSGERTEIIESAVNFILQLLLDQLD